MTISYSDLVILEFMEKNYPNQFATPKEKLASFFEVALANNGKFRNLSREEKLEMARKILERNFYSYEPQITQSNQRKKHSQREIYSINKNSTKLFLSIDHENFLFEVHADNGQHLGAINFRGELTQERDTSGNHDIRVS